MSQVPDKKTFVVKISPEEPVYVISVVSEVVAIPIWTLRKLDDMGVVKAARLGKKTRCYSQNQLQELKYISYLMNTRGVHISAVKVMLDMGLLEVDDNE